VGILRALGNWWTMSGENEKRGEGEKRVDSGTTGNILARRVMIAAMMGPRGIRRPGEGNMPACGESSPHCK
jgi:hypothetical protein